MPLNTPKTSATSLEQEFMRLVRIMDELREKCPWDKEQTIQTLRSMTIEETYELADAITDGDWKSIAEELGDLMLHIVFYARIGKEQQQFDLEQVLHRICEKLIYRHPHIYPPAVPAEGIDRVEGAGDVKKNWEKLKLREGKASLLSGVPPSLPATIKALRLQEKAAQIGFEWKQRAEVWAKVKEEMAELEEAVQIREAAKMEEELGDLLFTLINYSRFLKVDPELALERTNKKFMARFVSMEAQAKSVGKALSDMNLEEMDRLWETAKTQTGT